MRTGLLGILLATATLFGTDISGIGNVVNNGVMIDGQTVAAHDKVLTDSGRIGKREHHIDAFDRLVLTSSADITVTQAEQAKFIVSADEHLLDAFETRIKNGTLTIDTTHSYVTSSAVNIVIETPTLRTVEVDGTGSVHLAAIHSESLELIVHGTGSIHASGDVGTLRAEVRGTGDIDATQLRAQMVFATVSGPGDCRVYATDELTATVNGTGDILYSGTSNVTRHINGIGDIRRR